MSGWTCYGWQDFDPVDVPWSPRSEMPVMPHGSGIQWDGDNAFFNPLGTYLTTLNRPWNGYQVGARVLISAELIAIEHASVEPNHAGPLRLTTVSAGLA